VAQIRDNAQDNQLILLCSDPNYYDPNYSSGFDANMCVRQIYNSVLLRSQCLEYLGFKIFLAYADSQKT